MQHDDPVPKEPSQFNDRDISLVHIPSGPVEYSGKDSRDGEISPHG